MAEARAVELAVVLREARARAQALAALYQRLAGVGQPAAIRPSLADLASAKAEMAGEIETLEDAMARDLGLGPAPTGSPGFEPDPRAEGVLGGLRGEGLAAAFRVERGFQAALKEAAALAEGSPWASAVATLADQAAGHRRRVLDLYQRYS
jgi:hypothetical protein